MDTVIMVGQFILSLSILIILHECGHFFPAKWFKTRVEKFYLFFDPYFSLFSYKKGETEYGIGWLPLGGYVKISGMIDESFDKEQMEGPPQPWEFRSKPAWQRLIIMVGGVTVNFILGILLFAMIFNVWGKDYLPNSEVTNGIFVDSLGMQLGLKDGDKILQIGDKDFERFSKSAFINDVVFNEASQITVERNGSRKTLDLDPEVVAELTKFQNQKKSIFDMRLPYTIDSIVVESHAKDAGLRPNDKIIGLNGNYYPWYHEFATAIAKVETDRVSVIALRNRDTVTADIKLLEGNKLGIFAQPASHYYNFENEKYGIAQAIPAGARESWDFLSNQVKAFGQIFRGKIKAKDSLGSFITIGKLYGTTWDWRKFWNLTAMLSILLAFINILPIPALDGGHVMFLLWEVITGRKPSDKVLEYSTMAGFILLIMLMVYALGLDISRLF